MEQPVIAAILVAWLAEAFVLAYVMGRRGFDRGAWITIGMALGPLALPVAVYDLTKPPASSPDVLHAGSDGDGVVDVLIGIDGSAESAAALRHVQSLLGPRVGRLTLAHVMPIDAGPEAEAHGRRLLAAAGKGVGAGPAATQLVLRGRPVDALRTYAERLGYELLAVGTRGDGATRGLLGSVASGLARSTGVPVLLVDSDDIDLRTLDHDHAVVR